MSSKKKILVTSALPYANGPIHIGHLVEYIQTDIYVRFLKLIREDVIYCCADDAHGAPIEIAAMKEGIQPEEIIAKFHDEHQEDFKSFHIHFDSYYTTNSTENQHFSNLIFTILKKNKFIYKKDVELTFCPKCKRFLPDRYVKGTCPKCHTPDQYGDVCESCNATYKTTDLIDPYCSICGTTPERKISSHYFFKLSRFSNQLDTWLSENTSLQPEIVHYIKNWITEGLEDWDISRDGPYFGFRIPEEENLYYYVWLDAPIGYIASTQNYCIHHHRDAEKDYWKNKNTKIIHFIGKDIIYFHFLFWPAMLMGSGFNLPSEIIVHGFLTVNNQKMSKSRGTFFTAKDFAKHYSPEYLRYYYAKSLSKKLSDINFDAKDFRDVINNELAANVGNFCHRVLSFTHTHFNGKIDGIDNDPDFFKEMNTLIDSLKENYLDVNLKEAVKNILALGSLGNKYFQTHEPWKLVKSDPKKTHRLLGTCIHLVKLISIVSSPILPEFSTKLNSQLKMDHLQWNDTGNIITTHTLGKSAILIEKIEEKKETLFPLNLKVATILEVKPHPDADKLYILKIKMGHEQRQLVAGLRAHYKTDELINKNIIVVSNLKPAKLRGVESQGMLLAGEDAHGNVGILTAHADNGSPARFGNVTNNSEQISYEDFAKLTITIEKGKVQWDHLVLTVDGKPAEVDKVKTGTVH